MSNRPFDPDKATALLASMTGKYALSPKAACGENGISYNDLLRWLDANEDEFAYRFELALAKRALVIEMNYLTTTDTLSQKIFLRLLEVANPEAYSLEKGVTAPGKRAAPAVKPFAREWVDTEEGPKKPEQSPEDRELINRFKIVRNKKDPT